MPFWDPHHFCTVDSINAAIWRDSPALQRMIQPPEQLLVPGSTGPQQAMLESNAELGVGPDTILPWVPDIVGGASDRTNGLLIFGAAYAGFIWELSTRPACMQLAAYVAAARSKGGGWVGFQRQFLAQVVAPDHGYYDRLAALLSLADVAPSRIVLSDLCPNSLVKRGAKSRNGRRRDSSRQPSGVRAPILRLYVDHPSVSGWTRNRILGTHAKNIITLGHIAEHGILRLFHRLGATITCGGNVLDLGPADQNSQSGGWVDRYADSRRKLSHWLQHSTWWTIQTPEREWRILPVYHPARSAAHDPGYARTAAVLLRMLA